jgi:hypothetical protein
MQHRHRTVLARCWGSAIRYDRNTAEIDRQFRMIKNSTRHATAAHAIYVQGAASGF